MPLLTKKHSDTNEADSASREDLIKEAEIDVASGVKDRGWLAKLAFWRGWERHRDRDASQWTGGTHWSTKASTVAMAAALLCGPAAAAKVFLAADPPPPTQSGGYDHRMTSRQSTATDMAQRAVRGWLTASQENSAQLASWWNVTDLQLPRQGMSVGAMHVVTALPTAPGVWSIRVGADVTAPGSAARFRYFQVPIAVTGDGVTAAARPLALPSEVAAPSLNVGTSPSYPGQITTSSGVWSTAQGFLAAMLAGEGNPTLYTRPGVYLPAVTPSPWGSARVTAVQASNAGVATSVGNHPDGTTIRALVTVSLTPARPTAASAAASSPGDPSGAPAWPGAPSTANSSASSSAASSPTSAPPASQTDPVTAQYQLVFTQRANRWEVSALDPAPQTNTPTTPDSTK